MLPHSRAFENLWKNHRMNKTQQGDNADAKFDNDALDVYTLNEDHLWTTSELEEMKKPKRTQEKKSAEVLEKTNDGEGDAEVDLTKRVLRSKGRGSSLETESRPDFYHGVGPCNDVNLPGVWFFRIPHKVCNKHDIYKMLNLTTEALLPSRQCFGQVYLCCKICFDRSSHIGRQVARPGSILFFFYLLLLLFPNVSFSMITRQRSILLTNSTNRSDTSFSEVTEILHYSVLGKFRLQCYKKWFLQLVA